MLDNMKESVPTLGRITVVWLCLRKNSYLSMCILKYFESNDLMPEMCLKILQ